MTDQAWLDPKSPAEVEAILAELRSRLERIYGDRLRGMYLYGSYARGEPERGSDLDVLIVLDEMESGWEEIQRTSYDTAEISLDHELTISTIFMPERRWLKGDTTFLRNVREEGWAV